MGHFTDIGFKVDTTKDLQKVSRLIRKGQSMPATKHNYSCVNDKSGASLWFWYSEKGIECLNPHFNGTTESKVFLIAKEIESKCENCIVLVGWMSPTDNQNPESGSYPFGFSIPNFFTLEKIIFPQLVSVQITAFAGEIKVYKDEKDFSNNKKDFAPCYFIPSGRFPVDEKRRAESNFAGKVEMVKKMRNALTRQKFYWMIVDTYGTKIDVVCDDSMINHKVVPGNIIDGTFWLSGKIIQIIK